MVLGSPVAVCVRCLGIYWGVGLGSLLGMGRGPAGRLLAMAAVLNLLDVATASLHWHGNLPLPRFLLGLVLGVGAGAVLFSPLISRVRFFFGGCGGIKTVFGQPVDLLRRKKGRYGCLRFGRDASS